MKLRSIVVVFLGLQMLQICQPAIAGSLFRCEVDGRVEFTDRRCQPVKQKPSCPEKDGKAPAQEPQHGQCATPAPDTSKAPVISPAAQARTGNGVDWPGRLALNEISSSTESKPRVADTRSGGANPQNVGSRSVRDGTR